MEIEEIRNAAVEAIVEFARKEAKEALQKLDLDEAKELIEARVKTLTEPLEEEIDTTDSVWVKVRNRFYIIILGKAVDAIVEDVKKKIEEAVA